jgi:hypothetical protein
MHLSPRRRKQLSLLLRLPLAPWTVEANCFLGQACTLPLRGVALAVRVTVLPRCETASSEVLQTNPPGLTLTLLK